MHVVSKPSAPDALENIVNIEYDGRREKLTLYRNRINLAAVKEAFGLQTVKVNGRIEPVDAEGFTLTKYSPHGTVTISGTPTSEMSSLFGEVAALRADLNKLASLRFEIKDSAGLTAELADLKKDLRVMKRLVAEIVAIGVQTHQADKGPDFTKTSHDGYNFDTWWEAQCLARDIISGDTKVKSDSSTNLYHPDDSVEITGLHIT